VTPVTTSVTVPSTVTTMMAGTGYQLVPGIIPVHHSTVTSVTTSVTVPSTVTSTHHRVVPSTTCTITSGAYRRDSGPSFSNTPYNQFSVAGSHQGQETSQDVSLQQAIRRLQQEGLNLQDMATHIQDDSAPDAYDSGLRFSLETALDEQISLDQLLNDVRQRHPMMPPPTETVSNCY